MSRALFEGEIEGAVTPVAAVVSQFLDSEGAVGSYCFAVEANEMIDAEIIDICVIIHLLAGVILTEIVTVCTDSLGKLGKGQVVLQIELCVDAILL